MRPQTPINLPDPSVCLSVGWHCLHIYYQVNQAALNQVSPAARQQGREELVAILGDQAEGAPARQQVSIASGHRADMAVMLMDRDPLVIDRVKQAIRACAVGTALVPTYSFVSITEISEYVPTVDQYAERLKHEGVNVDDPAFAIKLKAYEQRLPTMNQQRLYPDIPPFPNTCFYPMNKARHPLANWYLEPFSVRSQLMAEHATSGIQFAGRVSQLITASTGFDDWEWGVTLWARTPEAIKDIVYTMRFDNASAKYAEFGPFYVSYIRPIGEVLDHLRI